MKDSFAIPVHNKNTELIPVDRNIQPLINLFFEIFEIYQETI